MFSKVLTLLLLVSVSIGGPLFLTPPSEDDFYSPPDGYENAKLGDILKFREPPSQIRSIYFPVNVKSAWQILLRSEDVFGNPQAVVTTIFEPFNGNSSRVVSYQVAEDAVNVDCAPSFTFMDGKPISTIPNQFEMFLIQAALDQGFYVSAPDYEGPISAFAIGRYVGVATLNSIRAALSSKNITNIEPDAEVVLWGYSGGSIPSSWAAGLQPSYAPELNGNLIGATFGGWVTNLTATAEVNDGTIFAGFVGSAIQALANQYDGIQDFINDNVKPLKLPWFNTINDVCIVGSIVNFLFAPFFTGPFRYVKGGWSVFQQDVIKSAIDANTLGTDLNKEVKPEIPIFVYQAQLDEIVPYDETERVYDYWCDEGMNSFEFTTSITSGHISEAVEGCGAALGWISSIFNGSTPVNGCNKSDRLNTLLHPQTFGGLSDVLASAYKNVFGCDIGPSDSDTLLCFLNHQGVDVDGQKAKNNS